MQAAASGYVTEKSEETVGERPCLRLACDLPDDEGSVYTTWFDQETLLPLRSEISAEGTLVFQVAWTRFEVTGQKAADEPAAQPDQPAPDAAPDAGPAQPEAGAPAAENPQSPAADPPAQDAWAEADEAAAYAGAEE